ncbi:hypothetical protein ACMAZF_14950 [Psychrobium sp. nBUS_13]|uniref:hypothetical protein n=1 Tax=Psychrobium sp. nBUS_13 TaxID=3395319 RepID=UPI003EB8850C
MDPKIIGAIVTSIAAIITAIIAALISYKNAKSSAGSSEKAELIKLLSARIEKLENARMNLVSSEISLEEAKDLSLISGVKSNYVKAAKALGEIAFLLDDNLRNSLIEYENDLQESSAIMIAESMGLKHKVKKEAIDSCKYSGEVLIKELNGFYLKIKNIIEQEIIKNNSRLNKLINS